MYTVFDTKLFFEIVNFWAFLFKENNIIVDELNCLKMKIRIIELWLGRIKEILFSKKFSSGIKPCQTKE